MRVRCHITSIYLLRLEDLHRSDVHFWQHGRIGDSMVVTDEVSLISIKIAIP